MGNRLFKKKVNTSSFDFVLIASSELNDRDWKTHFGEFQHLLEQVQNYKLFPKKEVCFDFCKCIWADPTPFMSLSISIAKFCSFGGNVVIKLPSIERGSSNSNRFLKFLAKEGFLDLLVNQINNQIPKSGRGDFGSVSCFSGDEIIDEELILRLNSLDIPLKLKRAFCLPCQLISFERPEISTDEISLKKKQKQILSRVDKSITGFINNYIDIVVNNEVPVWAQAGLTYRVHMFCREALHNVVEHAYLKEPNTLTAGFAVLYIRYRQGIYGASQFEANSIKKISERESEKIESRVPKLDFDFVRYRFGFFEVFMVDSGQGLTASDNELSSQSGLNGVMWKLLKFGFSRKAERTTKYGGLHLVRELIDLSMDYVRVYDNDQWWGAQFPLPDSAWQAKAIESAKKIKDDKHKSIKGVSWCIRFSWLEKPNLEKNNTNWMCLDSKNHKNYLDAYSSIQDLESSNLTYFLDKRINGEVYKLNQKTRDKKQISAFLLPSSGWMKNKIQKELKKFAKELQHESSIIIGDINPFEAHAYIAAIKEAKIFNDKPLNYIEKIVLITTSLSVVCLTRKTLRYGDNNFSILDIDNTFTENYLNNHDVPISANSSLLSYLMQMRYCDSKRLWSLILAKDNKSALEKAVIKESVRWNPDLSLSQFLDFIQLLSVPTCRTLFSINLERILSLFKYKSIVFRPLDTLTEGIVSVFNTKEHLEYNDNPFIVFIGSIQVTGSTVEKIVKKYKNFEVLHFFQHPDGPQIGKHLLGWPKIENLTSSINSYRRVGDTPMIAKGGWKYYNLPRYDSNNKSLYVQKPPEFYNTIQVQSRPLMKLGHWEYGTNHDFMTLNVIAAFDSELDSISILAGSKLASFIYLHLFRIFDLKLGQLSGKGKEIFRRINPITIHEDQKRYYIKTKHRKNPPIFVYISHTVTDHILEQFMNLIDDEVKLGQIQQNVIPIVPLKMKRSGSTMCLSGLTMEKIESIVEMKSEDNCKTNAVLFDDAIISSRTQREVKSLLKSLGVDQIYSIFFLDRQRLPSADYMMDENTSCFWRLDLPLMGSTKSCTLCSSLKKINDFSKIVLSPFIKNRINEWKNIWGPKNPSIQWGGVGINPLPVKMKNPYKKYGIDIDFSSNPPTTSQKGGEKNLIKISNSAGLIAWVSELHAMTSRNDLVLTLLEGRPGQNEEFSPEVIIQLITSQMMVFYNEFNDTTIEKFAYYLLISMFEIESDDKHTSIAAIALLTIDENILYTAVEKVVEEKEGFDIFTLNLDLQIIFAIASNRAGLNVNSSSTLSIAKFLLKPKDIIDYLWRFHIEVTDVRGKSHTSPLHRLLQSGGSDLMLSQHKIYLTLEFLTKLFEKDILKGLLRNSVIQLKTAHSFFNPKSCDHVFIKYTNISEYILNQLSVTKGKISFLIENKNAKSEIMAARSDLEAITNDLLTILKVIHEQVFYPLRLSNMSTGKLHAGAVVNLVKSMNVIEGFGDSFKDARSIMVKENNFEPIVKLNDLNERQYRKEYERYRQLDFQEVYVLWNAEILWVFENIYSNIKHTKGKEISNPWNTYESESSETAHMWINAKIDDCLLEIEFTNANISESNKPPNNLERALLVLKNYGGSFELDNKNYEMFKTIVRLPLAHALKMEDYCEPT